MSVTCLKASQQHFLLSISFLTKFTKFIQMDGSFADLGPPYT